jgi:hypothetical protein
MEKATTFSQWYGNSYVTRTNKKKSTIMYIFHCRIKLAEDYDSMHEKLQWRENPVSSLYEWKRVQEHTEKYCV